MDRSGAPVALQPPVITQTAPNEQTVTVGEGQKLTFAVEATSAQLEPLRYVWFLDGRERAWGLTLDLPTTV